MLIAIEGIDGSGKGTQARQLHDRLMAEGTSAALLSFPRYSETVFGGLIGDYLNGRFGTLEQVHPLLASLLFSGDRFESLAVLRNACERHEVVILDRYVASNIAHQGSRTTAEEQPRLMELIDRIEHEVFRLPRADLTVLLDIPVETAVDLIARKKPREYTDQTADLHEANVSYLEGEKIDLYIATERLKHNEKIPFAPKGRIPKDLTVKQMLVAVERRGFLAV